MDEDNVRVSPDRDAPRSRRRDLLGLLISAVLLAAVVWWALEQQRPTFPSSPEDLFLLVVAVGLYAVATVVVTIGVWFLEGGSSG